MSACAFDLAQRIYGPLRAAASSTIALAVRNASISTGPIFRGPVDSAQSFLDNARSRTGRA